MSTEPTPIKPGILPEIDTEREMLAYVAERLRAYVEEHGEPFAIAFVIVGQDKAGSNTAGYSFAPGNEGSSRLHTCSVASAVMLKRALDIE